VRDQAGGQLAGPRQDGAAHAVRDHRHRAAAAQLPDLRDEQVTGLVEVDAGDRRGLGGKRLSVERALEEGRRAPGA
jgi:hypothetical protein